ncbi:MAG: sodium:melibiose symporter [Verrucomicrobia bacterium]|nr:sodium:melibiose symporter [Verrucomicrobiota bacterium]
MSPPTLESAASKREVALSRKELAAYGSGIIGYQYPHYALAHLALPLFNIGLGIGPAAVGAILMGGRIWEALSNPLVGALSDNTRTRWGRRRPYILIGAILTGMIYPLVWLAPRSWGNEAIIGYILVSTLALYTAFSVFSVPYIALGLELTPDYHERTKVQVWRTYFSLVPGFTSGWFLWFCKLPAFGDIMVGARWLGSGVGLLILLAGVIPAIFLTERYYQVAKKTRKEPFVRTMVEVLKNKPFGIMMIVITALELGRFTTDNLGFYVLAYHVYGGDTSAAAFLMGINTTVLLLISFATIPAVQKAELRWGKIVTLRLCLAINILADLLKWFLASPSYPWAWISINVLTTFGGLGFWILVNSMKADICDWDELETGKRREGSFSAIAGLLQKTTAAVTLWLAGLMLQWVGFDASKAGQQEPETIFWLRVAYFAPSVVMLGIGLWALRKYELDLPTMQRVRAQLELRRAAV